MAFHVSTLWITRHSEDTPELIEAWDHFSIDGNPDGWKAACRKALDAVGDDLRDHAYLTLVVPEEPVFALLYPEVDAVAVKVMAGAEGDPPE